jgi:tetratricopeptide (TPR) repeat protein
MTATLLVAAPARAATVPAAAPAVDATAARSLLLHGRYEEARKAYERLAARDPVTAAIGIARTQAAVGARDEATKTLTVALEKRSPSAPLLAERAGLAFSRGDYAAARADVDAARAVAPDLPAARWLTAELDRVNGQLEQADEGYHWFVRYYNAVQDTLRDPEVFRLIGLAAAEYARWNRNSGQFHFLVNTLYPDALARDSTYWPAYLETARLFIEKYNLPEAAREVRSGLAINPRSAELHAARARIAFQQFDLDSARAAIDHALAIDPTQLEALRVRADVLMLTRGPRAAVATLERARTLDPADEETLGRLAAVYGASDGLGETPTSRMGGVVAEATKRNPHCGVFYAALAASLDLMRKYPHAARYYGEARQRMPQLVAVPGQLGLVQMRLGDEAEAKKSLDEAFEVDPFNVRVKNSLDVLDVLAGYGRIETAHFVLRFDPVRDSLLARYASRWLEDEVYPEITKRLAYAPREKSLIEIFSSAKGGSGHQWFSTRMVGLPFIGTVGACAGKMVAITSPNDGRTRFNWARVLKHEFVHIVNLQQTDFNIPHWYTEGLAVRNEGPGRPQSWDRVLAQRAAADSLFDLDTIDLGFARPNSGDDWTLAYYQAELCARYMADTYGPDAPNRMIAAYADNLDTRAALERCFKVTRETFDKGYRAYMKKQAAAAGPVRPPAKPAPTPPAMTLTDLKLASDRTPGDVELRARLARAYLERGMTDNALETGLEALKLDPHRADVAETVARAYASQGKQDEAIATLSATIDRATASLDALALLANLALEAKRYPAAESLAKLGAERYPLDADWLAGLAVVYRETGQKAKLAEVLERSTLEDSDDAKIRMELARLAEEQKNPAAAGRWALEAIRIDVTDPDAHAIRARSLTAEKHPADAVEEWAAAVSLKPDRLEWRFAEAEACVAAGRKDDARRVLDDLIARNAAYPGAKELRRTLGK